MSNILKITKKDTQDNDKNCPIQKKEKRVLGRDAGKGWISEDFDEPLPELDF